MEENLLLPEGHFGWIYSQKTVLIGKNPNGSLKNKWEVNKNVQRKNGRAF